MISKATFPLWSGWQLPAFVAIPVPVSQFRHKVILLGMQALHLLTLAAVVASAVASWLPVHDNNGSPVCTVGGTLQCQGGHCECVGAPPTVMPPPCDTTMWSQLPDCYSQCRDSDGSCMTYYSCPAGFSKSEMIWTCESSNLASLLGYDYVENVKLLANHSYSRVITSSTHDDGETWTPSCYSPENYAVGYQTCYTLDPTVGVPTTTTTTTTTTTWGLGPMVWENVGEPGKSACRGRNASWHHWELLLWFYAFHWNWQTMIDYSSKSLGADECWTVMDGIISCHWYSLIPWLLFGVERADMWQLRTECRQLDHFCSDLSLLSWLKPKHAD